MPHPVAPSPYVQPLEAAIARLTQYSQQDIQSQWRVWLVPEGEPDLSAAIAFSIFTGQSWPMGTLNERQHIAWPKGRRILWLAQRIEVPDHLYQYPLAGLSLRLAIAWWANAASIYVNGQQVQEGDLFDCSTRIVLSDRVTPGDCFEVAVRLESPGHDPGALVRSQCVYETDYPTTPYPEPGFVADELAVVQRFLAHDAARLEQAVQVIEQIHWDALPDRTPFDASLATVRHQLAEVCPLIKHHQIWSTGHAHLDMAWLWPVTETWQAAERTFQSVLALQQEFPELLFCHSTPALYAWMEEHRPDLFAAIQTQVAAGRWEIVAGLWIEPELNIISGESIVRQVLYGQRYVAETFGQRCAIAWLPDSFGFCWQLPQILAQGGITYFVTQKLRWNDTTTFPYDLFWWRSPDGSQILAYNSPLIGESIHPTRMANYACEWQAKTGQTIAHWLPGVGDHGGGPTRDMLETARRWARSPLFPQLEFATVQRFLDTVTAKARPELPVWNDELYLELHRGCYTTHADQKRYNRRCEAALYQAELWSSLATLIAHHPYPQADIEQAWKTVLFNQFHDILPGSSIPQVFADANQDWAAALTTAETLMEQALGAIASCIDPGAPPHPSAQPVLVFNPLNWARSEVVAVPIPASSQHWHVYDADGHAMPYQVSAQTGDGRSLLVWVPDVPSVGYTTIWLVPDEHMDADPPFANPGDRWTLENEHLRVDISPETGDIQQIYDKANQRNVLSAPGNQLQAFQDAGQYWDAWNIAPDYANHPLPPTQLGAIAWVEFGSVRQRLRVTRHLGQSTFQQDYVLDRASPLLQIETVADWQESQVLLKAAFPLQITASAVNCEMPFGVIARSVCPQTDAERAKWEVPALQWADLTDDSTSYGVSVLNDCKYGYDAAPNQLRLTLLKAPLWPDPTADRGRHEYRYAIYPHCGNWAAAQTVRYGYAFNQPLHVWPVVSLAPSAPSLAAVPACHSFWAEHDSFVLTAFKRSEDNPEQWILRGYESHGKTLGAIAPGEGLAPYLDLAAAELVTVMEEPADSTNAAVSESASKAIAPWKVITLRIPVSGR